MSSNEFLAGSFWHPRAGSSACTTWELLKDGSPLAVLTKVADRWYGRVLPNANPHLPPQASLHKAMCQAISFIRKREGEK